MKHVLFTKNLKEDMEQSCIQIESSFPEYVNVTPICSKELLQPITIAAQKVDTVFANYNSSILVDTLASTKKYFFDSGTSSEIKVVSSSDAKTDGVTFYIANNASLSYVGYLSDIDKIFLELSASIDFKPYGDSVFDEVEIKYAEQGQPFKIKYVIRKGVEVNNAEKELKQLLAYIAKVILPCDERHEDMTTLKSLPEPEGKEYSAIVTLPDKDVTSDHIYEDKGNLFSAVLEVPEDGFTHDGKMEMPVGEANENSFEYN